jgi:hypothetical protein
VVLLGALLGVLAVVGLWLALPPLLFKPVLKTTIESATGLECDFGSGRPLPGRDFRTDRFRLGPSDSPVLEVEGPVLRFDPGYNLAKVFLGRKRVLLDHPEWPRVEMRQVYLDYRPGSLHLQLDCTDLNPLLEKHGRIRFERGRATLEAPLELRRYGQLDCAVSVSLRDIKVRSLDGRFEAEAAEARATVRITGTLEEPKLDLGELEPWLGRGFVEGFGKSGP